VRERPDYKQDADTLRNVIQDETHALAIDLKNVDLVDREAVRFLAQQELDGTELRNCPPYIREWITKRANGNDEIQSRLRGYLMP